VVKALPRGVSNTVGVTRVKRQRDSDELSELNPIIELSVTSSSGTEPDQRRSSDLAEFLQRTKSAFTNENRMKKLPNPRAITHSSSESVSIGNTSSSEDGAKIMQ
jgi:hypothetical protein